MCPLQKYLCSSFGQRKLSAISIRCVPQYLATITQMSKGVPSISPPICVPVGPCDAMRPKLGEHLTPVSPTYSTMSPLPAGESLLDPKSL